MYVFNPSTIQTGGLKISLDEQISILKQQPELRDAVVIGAGSGLSTRRAMSIREKDLRNISTTLSAGTVSGTCIPADFTRIPRWRHSGASGATISGSIAIRPFPESVQQTLFARAESGLFRPYSECRPLLSAGS